MTTATGTTWRNWSGLEQGTPREFFEPGDAEEIARIVTAARERGGRVKMPGTGHSFTGIAVPDDVCLAPTRLSGVLNIDPDAGTATVAAGTPLHVLNQTLAQAGYSLHNMGDIAEQTLAGATSTGTHGTGGTVASLSAQLVGVELVDGTGTVRTIDADHEPELLDAVRLGLGALGILTRLTVRIEPLFTLAAHEFPLRWSEALGRWDEIVAAHDHAEFYWFPHTTRILAKTNDRTSDSPEPLPRWRTWLDDEFLSNTVFGWVNGLGNSVPRLIPTMNNLAGQALSERRYSDVPYKVFTSPRSVVFREMEYAVPREIGLQALADVRRWVERSRLRISFPVEVRTTPADPLMLSTSAGRESMYLAFHVNAATDHRDYFAGVEEILRGYEGRPHWGKLHTQTAATLAGSYPRWAEFLAIRDRLDPDRVFANRYLTEVLGS